MEQIRHLLCSYSAGHRRTLYLDAQDGNVIWDESPPPWFDNPLCRYCSARLVRGSSDDESVGVCQVCGWWRFGRRISSDVLVVEHLVWGVAKEYKIDSLEIPLEELRRHLAIHPNHMAHVHYTRFEELMQSCLRAAYPGTTVEHVGRSGDRGIDLILANTAEDAYLVQVKRRMTSKNEGVRAVRELNGVLFREGKAKGMLITSAPGFTEAARREVGDVLIRTSIPYEMKLLSARDVVELLRLPSPDPYEPWAPYLEQPKRASENSV